MSKHFAAGFDAENLYVCFKDQQNCKFITYDKTSLRSPISVEEYSIDTNVETVVANKGVSVLPDRLLRGRIGERLALYREIVEYNTIAANASLSQNNIEILQNDFIKKFANERPQLARALPTVIQDIENRRANTVKDFPENSQVFAAAVYAWKPIFAPTPISNNSVNTSSTELNKPEPVPEVATQEVKPWFDLDDKGVFLSYTSVPGVGEKLILIDTNAIADTEKLKAMEFIQPNWTPEFEKNIYFLNSSYRSVSRSALADALGIENCPIKHAAPLELEEKFAEQLKSLLAKNKTEVLSNSILLGQNREDDKVYQHKTENYRWIETQSTQYFRPEFDNLAPHTALYGFKSFNDRQPDIIQTEAALFPILKAHLAGDLKVSKMSHNHNTRILFGEEEAPPHLVHFVSEVYESAINKTLQGLYEKLGNESNEYSIFKRTIDLYDSQPKKLIKSNDTLELGQYSTPVPMSFIAQKLLIGNDKPESAYSVLEPTIGTGSLINNLPNAVISGVELDERRFAIASLNSGINVIHADATETNFKTVFNQENGFDYVISNPPFAPLDKAYRHNGVLEVKKLDHLIALKALEARKDEGRTVLIIGNDGIYNKGKAQFSSISFINYLTSHYEYLGGIELDSALYARNGANTNTRMLVIGNKLEQPIADDRLGEKLGNTEFHICKNYEELYTWSQNLIQQYPKVQADYQQLMYPDAVVEFGEFEAEPLDFSESIQTDIAEVYGETVGVEFVNITMPLFDPTETRNQKINDIVVESEPRLRTKDVIDDTEQAPISVTNQILNLPIDDAITIESITERRTTPSAITQPIPAVRVENEYQTPYLPKSQLGAPSAMIPINMSAATYAALNSVEQYVLDSNLKSEDGEAITTIDQYVANRLQYSAAELEEYFSPEQIDAIALGIYNHDHNRGIINADQTGMGKGRFVAAMMRFAKIENATPIFLTYKPALFTDIYRDINDIGSLEMFGTPFTVNNVAIRRFDDPEKNLVKSMRPIEHKKIIESGSLPEEYDVVLATYSQVAKDYMASPKAKFLEKIAGGTNSNPTMVFLDESHLAAGESYTGANIQRMLENTSSVIYSSATPLKQAKHFGLYSRVFPASVDIERLPQTLETGGEALQEAISTAMAEDGVLIRREHDFSELTFKDLEPNAAIEERNREVANDVAEVLSMMAHVSADVLTDVHKLNDKFAEDFAKLNPDVKTGARMKASSMNFGSRMYHINRQFLLGSKIDMVANHVVDEINAGRKPVIGVESTAASLLDQLIETKALSSAEQAELEGLNQSETLTEEGKARLKELNKIIADSAKDLEFKEPPQFKDYLNLMLNKLGTITIKNGYGVVTKTSIKDDPNFISLKDNIKEKIDELPYIPLTPLDLVREKLHENAMTICEISGRTKSGQRYLKKVTQDLEVDGVKQKQTIWAVRQFPQMDHAEEIGKFQNGTYDAAVITRSGSTGYSLHATNKYENSDYRQRNFIGLEKAANIADHLQWIGRVNRKGQVIAPIITNVESGLPAERRLTMMHNAKLRKLSANTTSNRDNSNMESEIDLLNTVGDEVALRFLMQNRSIAQTLDLNVNIEESDFLLALKTSNENQYINKLMGRLVLLPVETQEDVITTLEERFSEKLIELEAEGKNPFKVDVFDWKARKVESHVLDDYNEHKTNSSFDTPVNVMKLVFDVKYEPMPADKLHKYAEKGIEQMFSQDWMENYPELAQGSDLSMFKEMAKERILRRAFETLPDERKTKDFSNNPDNLLRMSWKLKDSEGHLKDQIDRSIFVYKALGSLSPGQPITVMNEHKEEQIGIITSIKMPKKLNGLGALSNYEVKLVFTGSPKVEVKNLASLYMSECDQGQYGRTIFTSKDSVQSTLDRFWAQNEEIAQKTHTKTVTVLQDNLFKAVEMASEQNLGRPILYTDESGNRQRAVLLKSWVNLEDVMNGPVKLSPAQIHKYVDSYIESCHLGEHANFANGNKPPIFTLLPNKKSSTFQIGATINERNVSLRIYNAKSPEGKRLLADDEIFMRRGKSNPDGMNLLIHGTNQEMDTTITHDQFFELIEKLQEKKVLKSMYLHDGAAELLDKLKQDLERKQDHNNSIAVSF